MSQELRCPDSPFPIEITAYDAAGDARSSPVYKFGMDTEKAIAALRTLADGLEHGQYVLQGIESAQKAFTSDYAISSFTVNYVAKRVAPEVADSSLVPNATI